MKPRPNKRLKLTGGDPLIRKRSVVPWRARTIVQHHCAPWAIRPQLKRGPLGTHDFMTRDELTPSDLESEFRRVGTTWQEFVELVRVNGRVGDTSRSFGIQLDIARTLEVVKSLPDGAGSQAFLAAFKTAFAEPAIKRMNAAEARRRKRGQRRGGAGA